MTTKQFTKEIHSKNPSCIVGEVSKDGHYNLTISEGVNMDNISKNESFGFLQDFQKQCMQNFSVNTLLIHILKIFIKLHVYIYIYTCFEMRHNLYHEKQFLFTNFITPIYFLVLIGMNLLDEKARHVFVSNVLRTYDPTSCKILDDIEIARNMGENIGAYDIIESIDFATPLMYKDPTCCNNCNISKYPIPLEKCGVCSGCKKIWYCSRKCQKLDWKNHKNKCNT
ncbi:zinc finger MYND domain-containing protein [bacterium]|nr:MAG: zinc finger MYND domain-containing protein [bacterium]